MSRNWGSRVRGRFAPSPTGRLHLGNARSALLGWLQVHAAGGEFLLRIENLDASRCRTSYVDDLMRDLEYLGITWDEEPIFQSKRHAFYEDALRRLASQGRIFPCFCTRTEIARASSAPHDGADEGTRYPGTCANLSSDTISARSKERMPALRFRPTPGPMEFVDLVRGRCTQDVSAEVGDFVVRRNDGVASYQLAVVVDDAASGITDVLRAEDLLSSTPRQIQLYNALGLRVPRFAHVSLLLGEDGKRLAKRDGAFAVSELRLAKVPATRVIGLLAEWSGLSNGDPIRADELVSVFRFERLRREPLIVSEVAIKEHLLGR